MYELETGSVIGLVPSGSVFALDLSVLHFLQNHLERDGERVMGVCACGCVYNIYITYIYMYDTDNI